MEQFTPEVTTKKTKIKRAEDSASLSMFKVFLWMGLGLLITGVIALGMPDFLLFLINTMGMSTSAVNTTYITLMVVSSLLPRCAQRYQCITAGGKKQSHPRTKVRRRRTENGQKDEKISACPWGRRCGFLGCQFISSM